MGRVSSVVLLLGTVALSLTTATLVYRMAMGTVRKFLLLGTVSLSLTTALLLVYRTAMWTVLTLVVAVFLSPSIQSLWSTTNLS